MLPIAATLVRIIVGIMFLMHVSTKFKLGADAVAANVFAKNGIEPALMWTYLIMFLESAAVLLDRRSVHALFCGGARHRDAGGFAVCASAEGLCSGRWRIRVCAADRRGMFHHRDPRRRPLFGRPRYRQGAVGVNRTACRRGNRTVPPMVAIGGIVLQNSKNEGAGKFRYFPAEMHFRQYAAL